MPSPGSSLTQVPRSHSRGRMPGFTSTDAGKKELYKNDSVIVTNYSANVVFSLSEGDIAVTVHFYPSK